MLYGWVLLLSECSFETREVVKSRPPSITSLRQPEREALAHGRMIQCSDDKIQWGPGNSVLGQSSGHCLTCM